MKLNVTVLDHTAGTRRDHLVDLPDQACVADLARAVADPDPGADPAGALARHAAYAGAAATAGAAAGGGAGLAAHLAAAGPALRPAPRLFLGGTPLDPARPVRGSGIRPGSVLGLGGATREPDPVRVPAPGYGPVLAELHLVSGPAAGQTWRLAAGSYEIGTEARCAIRISGPDAPERGLWLTVAADGTAFWQYPHGDQDPRPAEVRPPPTVNPMTGMPAGPDDPVDEKSGDEDSGEPVDEADGPYEDLTAGSDQGTAWPVGTDLAVGAVLLRLCAPVEPDAAVTDSADGIGVDYNRPPRIVPHLDAERVRLPAEPLRPARLPFPFMIMFLPIVLGLVLVSVFRSYFYLVFVLFTPVMVVSNWLTGKRTNRRQHQDAQRRYRLRLRRLHREIHQAVRRERLVRNVAGPDPASLGLFATGPGGRLWERRRRDGDHLLMRLGTVDQPSVKEIDDSARDENHRTVRWTVPDVPVGLELPEYGVIGVAGAETAVQGLARWFVMQAAVLHSPRDVRVVVLTDPARARQWSWLQWLPHACPAAPNGPVVSIGNDPVSIANRVAELVSQVQSRERALGSSMGRAMFTDPDILVIADGARELRDVPGMVQVLADGPRVRVFSICLDQRERLLPEECNGVVVAADHTVTLRRTGTPDLSDIRADLVTPAWCERVARALAPLRDVSPEHDAGLPREVLLLDLLDQQPPDPDRLAARWRRQPATTSFVLGTGYDGPMVLDLVRDGPHGLVAGTTGSGKSELLQSLVAALAAGNRPDELTFVLVDYKGGSAFHGCADLPHTLGMVTDLDPHLVQRALDSLGAELRRREHVLARAEAKDLATYRAKRAADPTLPRLARLLLVIDEFATLVREVPDFVPGLISIAQRGRSLGIHLILATQRPAGSVTPDIKANTNLRIALRVTDPVDSQDIIDTNEAAHISPSTPGRALVRYGHRSSVPFQAAWVGAERPETEPGTPVATKPVAERAVRAVSMSWGQLGRPVALPVVETDPLAPGAPAPTDLDALVAAIRAATDRLDDYMPQPSPWLPALGERVLLDDLPPVARPDAVDTSLPPLIPYALEDVPALQQRRVAAIDLASFGHLYIIGAPRSGRTQVLRTIAGSAAKRSAVRDVHMYGIDAAGGGLTALEPLPHCGAVVSRHDTERLERLLRRLSAELTSRQEALAAAGCGGLVELRRRTHAGPRPAHILLFIDGWDALAPILDEHDQGRLLTDLIRLVREGAAAGIHVIATSERSLLGGRISSYNDHKLLLRQADRNDYQLVGVSPSKVPASVVEGRGWHVLSRTETQVALLAADDSGRAQAEALRAIGAGARRKTGDTAGGGPFRIAGLPTRVEFTAVYEQVPAEQRRPLWAVLGVGGDEGGPVGVDLATTSAFVVSGAPGTGRSNALACLAVSLLAGGTGLVVLTPRESPLRGLARHEQVRLFTEADPPADAVRAALESFTGPRVVVVDDADLLGSPAADLVLKEVAAGGRDRGMAVVYAGAQDGLSIALGHWISAARRSRKGLLLSPRSTTEGDVIGVRLATSQVRSVLPPGRAYATGPHATALTVQVPLTVLKP